MAKWHKYVACVDLGGTKINAAIAGISDVDAEILDFYTVPTEASAGAAKVVCNSLNAVKTVLKRNPEIEIVAVGMASGGVIDSVNGVVTHATDVIPGWSGTDLRTPFEKEFGVPYEVINDVHAHGLGEAKYGAGKDVHSMLMAAIGTGIGGCIIHRGKLIQGSHGAAGHIGHLSVPEASGIQCTCGRVGHLEGLASGPGILQLATRLGASSIITQDGRSLAAAAAAGDEYALKAYRISGFATGRVIGGLLNALDVNLVSLSGGVSEASPVWLEALHEGVAYDAMDVTREIPVRIAALGTHAALLGAAYYASVSNRLVSTDANS